MAQGLPREVLHHLQEPGVSRAREPVRREELRADLGVIDDVAVLAVKVLSGLVHRHLREHVAVVVARGLVAGDVRHGHERPPGETALDLTLDVVRDRGDVLGGEVRLGHLVQRLLEVRHRDHAAQLKHLVRMLLADGTLQEIPRHGRAGAIASVATEPSGVAAQRIEEHRLRLRERHGEGRALL